MFEMSARVAYQSGRTKAISTFLAVGTFKKMTAAEGENKGRKASSKSKAASYINQQGQRRHDMSSNAGVNKRGGFFELSAWVDNQEHPGSSHLTRRAARHKHGPASRPPSALPRLRSKFSSVTFFSNLCNTRWHARQTALFTI
jgi:hypothetical protein